MRGVVACNVKHVRGLLDLRRQTSLDQDGVAPMGGLLEQEEDQPMGRLTTAGRVVCWGRSPKSSSWAGISLVGRPRRQYDAPRVVILGTRRRVHAGHARNRVTRRNATAFGPPPFDEQGHPE
jgi:hypothetical protein